MDHNFSYDVFLSHNSEDKPVVRELAKQLHAKGLRVWFDEWVIQPGDDIYLALEQGLQLSRTLILCISPAALRSEWVTLERGTALFRDPTNKHRRFVPVLLATCDIPDVIRRYKYIDWRRKDESTLRQLIRACTGERDAAVLDADEDLNNLVPWWSSTTESTGVRIVFENHPLFPNLEFSIANSGAEPVQITSIQIISTALEDYDDPGIAYAVAPISNLSYEVQGIRGKTRIFGRDNVCNLVPGEIERFRLAIDCQFSAAVLDIDIELVTSSINKSLVLTPDSIILVGCSEPERGSGEIVLAPKHKILDVVAGIERLPMHLFLDPTPLLIKSAPHLCRHGLAYGWEAWVSHLSNRDSLVDVLHSFITSGTEETPTFMLSYIENWISDVKNIEAQSGHSLASVSLVEVVSSNLSRLGLNVDAQEYLLTHLDATLERPLNPALLKHRAGVLQHLCKRVGSIEYLISVLMAIPAHTDRIHWLIYQLLKSSKPLAKSLKQDIEAAGRLFIEGDEVKYDFWKSWWSRHKKSRVYSHMQWREFSPRLIAILDGEQLSEANPEDAQQDGRADG